MIGKEFFSNLGHRDPDMQTPQRENFSRVALWGAPAIRMQCILSGCSIISHLVRIVHHADVAMHLMAVATGESDHGTTWILCPRSQSHFSQSTLLSHRQRDH